MGVRVAKLLQVVRANRSVIAHLANHLLTWPNIQVAYKGIHLLVGRWKEVLGTSLRLAAFWGSKRRGKAISGVAFLKTLPYECVLFWGTLKHGWVLLVASF